MATDLPTNSTSAASPDILQYRHSRHAGNHGDVLKHFVLVQLLSRSLPNTDINLIDTHAGIGSYTLPREGECQDGILRLFQKPPEDMDIPLPIREYVDTIAAGGSLTMVNELSTSSDDKGAIKYPGSPVLARRIKNPRYSLQNHFLFELHPYQYDLLQKAMDNIEENNLQGVQVECANGYQRAPTVLQNLPASTGGRSPHQNIILIDPPVKDVSFECGQVLTTVQTLLEIDPSCTVMVWLPLLSETQNDDIVQKLRNDLKQTTASHWTCATLEVSKTGLRGSSVWIANPPVGLSGTIEPTLPWLAKCLSQDCSISQWECSGKS